MKLKALLNSLQDISMVYPDADIYFTDQNTTGYFETYFQTYNIDEENNCIEMLFDTKWKMD